MSHHGTRALSALAMIGFAMRMHGVDAYAAEAFPPTEIAQAAPTRATDVGDRIFDVHVHIWNGEKSVKEYLAQLESTGQQVTGFGGIHMARRGELAHTRTKNDELVALAKRYPKLTPIASVHPYDGEAAFAELERLAGLGVKAIKLHPHTQEFDAADERVLAVCKRAGELGFVVLVDNANVLPGDNQKLFNLALKAPRTHFVFTHIGALEFRFWNLLPLARTARDLLSDNFHFDISGTVILAADSPLEEEFVWTLRNVGIDNLLLGSDFPQMSLKQAVDALERLGLTEEEKRKIRWENANRLFSLERTAASAEHAPTPSIERTGDWRASVRQFAEASLKHPAWGLSHSIRDYELAKELAATDKVTVDDDVLYAAAYLHDVAAFAPYRKADVDHQDEAARIVESLLAGTGFPMSKIEAVQGAIRTHMFQRDPSGPEAIYLHDADALDWLGAIGVARIFSLVDPNGGNPDGPAAVKRLESYLANVPPRIVSEAGKERSRERVRELEEFLRELRSESAELRSSGSR